jgi:8-oxo-dGTP pyrophosphatase MutT (NUDIX family)
MAGDIISAATVLLVRDGAAGLEVLMATRARTIDFAAGAAVFPGGKVAPADFDERWLTLSTDGAGLDTVERGFRVAAARETFEETGILLAHAADGTPVDPSAAAALAPERSVVERAPERFADVVAGAGLRLDLSAFVDFAHWLTPEGMPKRFDTRFLIAMAPDGQIPACDGGEATALDWLSPAGAVADAREGRRAIIFPTRLNLELLGQSGDAAGAVSAARARPLRPVTPRIIRENGEAMLVIRDDAGYTTLREALAPNMP